MTAGQPLWNRFAPYLYGILAGVAFWVVFEIAYAGIDPDLYVSRDDGVITLSHARNLVDYGHVGAEPSGQRSEGFSSPLQFWIYTAVYGLTGMGWARFGGFQTLVCSFLMGFVFVQFFRGRYVLGLGMSILGALALAALYRFLAWHGSGMENPWFHVGTLATLWVLWHAYTTGKAKWHWALIPFAASLARLEEIVHVLPLLVIFTVAWWVEYRNFRAMRILVGTLALWGLYQLWRGMYFGTLNSNTGLVQEIHPFENLVDLFAGSKEALRKGGFWGREILLVHGAWIMVLGLLAAPFARLGREGRLLLALCGCLVLTAFLNPFLFGQTRLDPARTTTFLAPVAVLFAVWVLHRLSLKPLWLAIPALGLAVFAYRTLGGAWMEAPRPLCCPVDGYREVANYADVFSKRNDLHRPTVSTPDLGKLSYLKTFNLADLGYLGSPVMARLAQEEDDLADYFFDFVAPDVVEVHGEWCIRHGRLLNDPRFTKLYVGLCGSKDYQAEYGDLFPDVEDGIYLRRDLVKGSGSREANLIRGVMDHMDWAAGKLTSKSLERIAAELATAMDTAQPPAHQYVVRTAYRFLPEFRKGGLEDSLIGLFAGTPTAPYDQAVLGSAGNRNWVREAAGFVQPYLYNNRLRRMNKGMGGYGLRLLERGRWRVYLLQDLRTLVVAIQSPHWGEMLKDCIVHVYPKDKEYARSLNRWATELNEFQLHWSCAKRVRDEYFFPIGLPAYRIDGLQIGLRADGVLQWSEYIDWPSYLW